MHLKPYLRLIFGALLICAAFTAVAQTAPAAEERRFPLAVGAGFSGYNSDFGGSLLGGTIWVDFTLPYMPLFLKGIGIEGEARDLNYGRSATEPFNLRQDVAEGGLTYSWNHFSNIRPYGKFLMGLGNTDYGNNKTRVRGSENRTIYVAGGGVDYRVYRKVWVRADYEYQFWPDFFKHINPPLPAGQLNPQGFTVGAMYHFSRSRIH